MIQEIITYLILMTTAATAVYRMYRFFKSPQSQCQGCASSDSNCKIAGLKKRLNSSGALVNE
jgi:hypothetical protein